MLINPSTALQSSASFVAVQVQVTRTQADASAASGGYKPSQEATLLLDRIADSRLLAKDQKRALTGLVALVDQFVTGKDRDKLMKSIGAIIQMLEQANAAQQKDYGKNSFGELLKEYMQARVAYEGKDVQQVLEVQLKIEQFSFTTLGLAYHDVSKLDVQQLSMGALIDTARGVNLQA